MNVHAGARPAPAPYGFVLVAGASFLTAGMGANGGLGLVAVAVIVVGTAVLWRPGEPPILAAMLGYQWMQASTGIFHAGWLGIDLAQHAEVPGQVELATVLSLAGLGAVVLGMRLGAGPGSPRAAQRARECAASIPLSRLAGLYVGAAAISFVAEGLAWTMPAVAQPLLAVRTLKWAAYFMLIYAALSRSHAPRLWWVVPLAVELMLGAGAFFSDFKTVLLVTALAAMAGMRSSRARMAMLAGAAVLAIGLGVTWSAVKGEYRAFVSRGEASQAVLIDYGERMAKLGQLVTTLDGAGLLRGLDALARRVAYVELLGKVLDVVPETVPHEGGAILWDAMSRPFMPRLLFPEKAIIDDSVRTQLFTGEAVTGSESTSISLGYIAEAYIDFGVPMMFLPLAGIGWVYGRIYAGLSCRGRGSGLAGMALATAVLMEGLALESSLTKVAGGMAVASLAALVAMRVLLPVAAPELVNGRAH